MEKKKWTFSGLKKVKQPVNPLDENPLDEVEEVQVEKVDYKSLVEGYKTLIKSHKKLLERWKKRCKDQKENYLSFIDQLKRLREEETEKHELEIGKLNQLIGIMKTGRIRYEREIELPNRHIPSDNFENHPAYPPEKQIVSGVVFLQEIQQVEVRVDHILIVTNSGREIVLGKDYDYLQNIFSIK